MRDVHNFSKTHSRVIRRNGTIFQTFSPSQQFYWSQRADSTPTVPNASGHYLPTQYTAFFSTTRTTAFENTHRIHNWPYTGNWTVVNDHSTGSTSDVAAWATRHGCNTFSLEPSIPQGTINASRDAVLETIRHGGWNVANSLGELPRTLDDLVDPMRASLGLSAAFKRNKNKPGRGVIFKNTKMTARSARALGSVGSGAYLSFIFGLLPLIGDIYNILKTVEDGLTVPDLLVASETRYDQGYGPPGLYVGTASTRKVAGKCIRGITTSVTFGLGDPTMYQLGKYGLTNPWALAWELVPLSFVVDWFVHVNSFLGSLIPPAGIAFRHGYQTKFVDNNWSAAYSFRPDPVPNRIEVVKDEPGVIHFTLHAMRRDPLPTFPISLPFLDMGLKGKINRITTLTALILRNLG